MIGVFDLNAKMNQFKGDPETKRNEYMKGKQEPCNIYDSLLVDIKSSNY